MIKLFHLWLIGLSSTVIQVRCYDHKTTLAIKRGRINYNYSIADSVSTFSELLEKSAMFIDKTLLISEIIHCRNLVTQIVCPRGWGKSINLSMVKMFLQIEVDAKGNPISPANTTKNYQLFHFGVITHFDGTTSKLKTPLLISQDQKLLNLYQGKHPVIYVDFKTVHGENFEMLMRRVRTAIFLTFAEHQYLVTAYKEILKDDKAGLKEIVQEDLNTFTKYLEHMNTVPHPEYALFFLSRVLNEHFQKTVYILVDNYDSIICNIFENPKFPKEDVKKTFMFFETFFSSAFNGNHFIEKGIMTGTYRIATHTLFSKLNNIVEHNFIHKPSSILLFYGLNEKDANELFQEHKIPRNLSARAKDWYSGYNLIKQSPDMGFYHLPSIAKFLRSKQLKSYWEETECPEFIYNLVKKSTQIRNKIRLLIQRRDILINMDHLRFSEEIVIELKDLLHSTEPKKIPPHLSDLFFALLLKRGYLTAYPVQYDSLTTVLATLPNYQMYYIMSQNLLFHYCDKYRIDDAILANAARRMREFAIDQVLFLFDLQDAMTAVFLHMAPMHKLIQVSRPDGIDSYDDLASFIIYLVLLKMQCMYGDDLEIYYKFALECNILIYQNATQRATLFVIQYNTTTAGIPLRNALSFKDILPKFNFIQEIVYVGVNVRANSTVHFSVNAERPAMPDEILEYHRKRIRVNTVVPPPGNTSLYTFPIRTGSAENKSIEIGNENASFELVQSENSSYDEAIAFKGIRTRKIKSTTILQ